jgi:hypothetical protein
MTLFYMSDSSLIYPLQSKAEVLVVTAIATRQLSQYWETLVWKAHECDLNADVILVTDFGNLCSGSKGKS